MKGTLHIALKECRIYFSTWISYVLITAFLEITSLFFYLLLREYQIRRLRYLDLRATGLIEHMNLTDLVVGPLFTYIATFFVFLLPLLTMRLIAEERRSQTLQLLLTSPIHLYEIILGKYLGALVVMVLMLSTSVAFPLALHLLGEPGQGSAIDWNTVLVGYLGMFCVGAAAIAIGMFASALSDSQVVGGIVAFALLLLLTLSSVVAQSQEGWWAVALQSLSLTHHVHPFARGILRLNDLLYFASLSFLGLFFSYRLLEAQRWN